MPASTPKQNDLRPARADFDALGRALVISLILHALTYGGYRVAKKYHWLENLRLPVRLGQDAFTTGSVSEETSQQAVDAFTRFRKIADDHNVEKIRAIATSASPLPAAGW